MAKKSEAVDRYLATADEEKRAALEALRETLHRIVEKGEECICYGMPAFRVGGSVVAGFAARAKGCSYYPFSGETLATLSAELKGYDRTKGALHFDAAAPPPEALIRKLVATRMAESDV